MEYRIERDSMGEVQVPADRYWAAQTQRSYQNFKIGGEKMPQEIVHAFGILKKAAAVANHRLNPERMDAQRLSAICAACDEVIAGKLERPLSAGGLADGQRHPVQHERQRGHRQPRQRARRQEDSAPERPREHVPVLQRYLSHGDAHRGGAGHRGSADARNGRA